MFQITKPAPGRWYWKEDSKTLEFASYYIAADFKEKAKKSKAIHFQEAGRKHVESGTENRLFLNAVNRSTPRIFRSLVDTKSQDQAFSGKKQINKHSHEYVTLDDVKNVALGFLEEHERQNMISFSTAIRVQQLDDFLMALLFYLSCYLERISLDKKPKSLMAKPSIVERREMADVLTRKALAEKHFAHMYCILVLGVGIPEQHHMACGRNKASATRKDRRFYESLYNFCTCVAWVVFRQKELDLIHEEVGRLLRSDTFNPALRLKDDLEAQQTKPSLEKKKTTKAINKRPAIKSILTQRSPALISLMPSPKEKASYLFQHHSLHPNSTYRATHSCNWMEMPLGVLSPRVGIIGEPRRQFNPQTLLPLGAEDDESENKAKKSNASFYSHGRGSPYHADIRGGLSRQSTVISRATTEGAYSDTE